MKRRLGLAAAMALCIGCRSPAPVYDPFLGRTTIEPPATAMPPPGQPYYGAPAGVSAPIVAPPPGMSPIPAPRPAGQQNFIPAPAGGGGLSSFSPNVSSPQPTPATTPRGANSNTLTPVSSRPSPAYAPPGAGYPQASSAPPGGSPTLAQGNPATGTQPNLPAPLDVDRMLAARGGSLAGGASASSGVAPAVNWETVDGSRAGTSTNPASFTSPSPSQRSIIRIVEPSSGAGTTNLSAGDRTSSGARVPEISELPPAYRGGLTVAPAAVRTTISQPATQQWATTASGASRAATASDALAEAAKPIGVFGYDPQYRSLRGKLEYSESTRQWRLRYIPPDGATDDYGGSVVLGDAAKLQGLQPGDLVRVEGSVGAASSNGRSFAPLYNLERIQKQ